MKTFLLGAVAVALALPSAWGGEAPSPIARAVGQDARPATVAKTNDAPAVEHLRTAFSSDVVTPNVITVSNVGRVRLIGVGSPDAAAAGYQKALKATQKFALRKSVKLDVCAARDKDEQGNLRAQVYFLEDGKWHNLNQKLLRAGLASVRVEAPCHVTFDGWTALVQQARSARRGLFGMDIQLPEESGGAAAVSVRPTATVVAASARPSNRLELSGKPFEPAGTLRIEPSAVKIKYLGNIQSRTFHLLDCICQPEELDRIFFADRFNAVKAGYRPCVVCRPK